MSLFEDGPGELRFGSWCTEGAGGFSRNANIFRNKVPLKKRGVVVDAFGCAGCEMHRGHWTAFGWGLEAAAARGATSGTAPRVGGGWCRWRVLATRLRGWEATAGPKRGLGSVCYPGERPGTVTFWFGANRRSPDQLISGSVQLLHRCPGSYRIKCKKAVQRVKRQ